MPPWGKIAGIRKVVKSLDLSVPLVHLNVYGSWSGWALSRLAKAHDFEFHMAFPKTKRIKDDYIGIVESNGAKLVPLRHNMFRVLHAQVENMRKENKWQMLPYAFNTDIYLTHMAQRLSATLELAKADDLKFSTLVVSAGSGVTCSALLRAFQAYNPNGSMYNVCVSSEKTVKTELAKKQVLTPSTHVILSEFKFDDTMPKIDTPFPCNQFWDKKAWHWLTQHAAELKGPILFWNLGGINTFV
jgi:cysteine synthase